MASRGKPLHYFLLSTGSWFLSYGLQGVTFAWLVTIVLREPAEMVGIAQMNLLAPVMFLILIGGSLADQFGGKPVAIIGQSLAAACALSLAVVIYLDQFSYSVLLMAAFGLGCAQAIVTPARDGLLPLVAEGRIQRTVVQSTMTQFAIMMLGFLIASFADRSGAVVILVIQGAVLLVGVAALAKIDAPRVEPAEREHHIIKHIWRSIAIGMQTVKRTPATRAVLIINCAMGLFFMSSYMVTMPLLLRELYGGGSTLLSWTNLANSGGLVFMIICLMRIGDIRKQGRALLVSHCVGALALASAALATGFVSLFVSVALWGLAGGLSVTTSRGIVQELSPPDQRARTMAFFSFSYMGAGPIGALFSGYMAAWLGPAAALLCSATAMMIVVVLVATFSSLWKLDAQQVPVADQ